MITLTIKKADNSIYWVERFNSQAHADKWLAEEMTRPYWLNSYVATSVETLPPVPTAEEIAAKAADDAANENARQFLKGLHLADLTDPVNGQANICKAIMKLVKHVRADQ